MDMVDTSKKIAFSNGNNELVKYRVNRERKTTTAKESADLLANYALQLFQWHYLLAKNVLPLFQVSHISETCM